MIIAFDGVSAVYENKRSNNYSRLLIDALSLTHPRNTYYIYSPSLIDNSYLMPIINRPGVEVKIQQHGLTSFMWRSVNGVLKNFKRHHVQVYHGLCGQLPLRINHSNVATVVTFENTRFLKEKGMKAKWKRHMATLACNRAGCVITLTEEARQQLITHLNADPARIKVVPPGWDNAFNDGVNESLGQNIKQKYKLPDKFIVIDARIMEGNPAQQVLHAIKQTGDKDLYLLLLGSCDRAFRTTLKQWAAENDMPDQLIILNNARTIHVPCITAQAMASVAGHDGYTFPYGAINAQIAQVPLITDTHNADIVGDGAIIVDINDANAIAGALNRIAADKELCDTVVARGKENVMRYTPENLAETHIAIYRKLLGK